MSDFWEGDRSGRDTVAEDSATKDDGDNSAEEGGGKESVGSDSTGFEIRVLRGVGSAWIVGSEKADGFLIELGCELVGEVGGSAGCSSVGGKEGKGKGVVRLTRKEGGGTADIRLL